MNQANFHDKLSFFSEALDVNELIYRVLDKQDKDAISIDFELVERVSSIIENFLEDNANQLTQYDIPALSKLTNTVHYMLEGRSLATNTLRSTIATAINVASRVIFIKSTPSDEIEFRFVLPPTIPDHLRAQTIEEQRKIILACKKYGVPSSQYDAFMHKFNHKIDGIPEVSDTPIIAAIKENNFAMLQVLGELGADVNKCNDQGYSPLIWAITSVRNIDSAQLFKIVQLLKNFGVNINQCSEDGDSPLMLAIEYDRFEIQTVLEEWGANRQQAEEGIKRITLSQIWGVSGISTYVDEAGVEHTLELSGSHRFHMAYILSTLVTQFFDTFDLTDLENHPLISKENQMVIKESLKNAFPLSSESNADRIKKIRTGKPFVILGGSRNHAISAVICENQLIIFNRGLGRQAEAANCYALDQMQVTEAILDTLTYEYEDMEDFNDIISMMLSSLPHLQSFDQQDQKTRNCSWASAKGAFGILCRLLTNPLIGEYIYKIFSTFARREMLDAYLEDSEQIDVELLKQIDQKCAKKPELYSSCSAKIKAKLSQLEHH